MMPPVLPTRVAATFALAVLAACGSGADSSPHAEVVVPERLRVLGDGGEGLFGVQGAAFGDAGVAVLTGSEPAVHLFTAGGERNWGKKGSGPAELMGPQNVAWIDGHLLVRDFRLRKIASFDSLGTAVGSRFLGHLMVTRMQAAGRDTLVSLFDPFDPTRRVLRLRGERNDTVLTWQSEPRQITLAAEGAPSLTLSAPFEPEPAWAGLADGRVAFWDGSANHVRVVDLGGGAEARLPLPADRLPVSEADREVWFRSAIPVDEFKGKQDVFAPLRERAHAEVKFPASLPAVLELQGDPDGGVWVRRTTPGAGELWVRLGAEAPRASFRLPAGRKLLAIGQTELAVRARDELDVETVEIYQKP